MPDEADDRPLPIMEAALARRLRTLASGRNLPLVVTRQPNGGLQVLLRGRALGVWRWALDRFSFVPADAGRAGFRAMTLMGAATYTLSLVDDDG